MTRTSAASQENAELNEDRGARGLRRRTAPAEEGAVDSDTTSSDSENDDDDSAAAARTTTRPSCLGDDRRRCEWGFRRVLVLWCAGRRRRCASRLFF